MNWDPRWNPSWHTRRNDRWRRFYGVPMVRRPRYRHWQPGDGPPPWAPQQRHAKQPRNRMFFRVAGVLIAIPVLTGGASAIASHIWTNVTGTLQPVTFFWMARICGLALGIPFLVVFIGSRIFRSYAVPLADIM